jgi:hypothetical protein
MANELATVQQLTPAVWQMLQSVGDLAYQSRAFGLKQHEGAVKMAVAYEFGLPVTTALSSVYVIDNKPVMAPKLLWAKAQAHPAFEGYEEERLEKGGKFEGWRITIKRKGMPAIARDFTMTQAAKVGLANKDNWKNYPEDVCYWRAIDRVLHVAFADVCMGLYAADELGMEITSDGEVIEAQWGIIEEKPRLQEMIDEYGADSVLSAITQTGCDPQTKEGMAELELWFATTRHAVDLVEEIDPEASDEDR